jgi:multimeric flavodoxin WrbA
MKIIAFNGSPRLDGNTVLLIKRVLYGLEKHGFETEMINISGQINRGCTACMSCRKNQDSKCILKDDQLNQYLEKMIAADGIIIGSPTYFANITAETKALIDRAGYVLRSNNNPLRRKVGAAVVAVRRAGAINAFNAINNFFLINEMIVPGSSYWNIGIGREKGEVETDSEALGTMDTLADNIAWILKCLNKSDK